MQFIKTKVNFLQTHATLVQFVYPFIYLPPRASYIIRLSIILTLSVADESYCIKRVVRTKLYIHVFCIWHLTYLSKSNVLQYLDELLTSS